MRLTARFEGAREQTWVFLSYFVGGGAGTLNHV